jgi:hypothetical protein
MLKFWCVLSLCTSPIFAVAQERVPIMRPIYVQDQRDRGVALADNGRDMLSKADAKKLPDLTWDEINKRDAARRTQVAALLRDGKLTTAEDFHDAAFIFQHGATAEDYLLAHVLAMDAMAKGDASARWIAAATLDRYLQEAGKKQVFGTQYSDEKYAFYVQHRDDKNLDEEMKAIQDPKQTLEPYDQTLVPDSVRADFCVPEQKRQTEYISAANAGQKIDLPRVKGCER